MIPSGGADLRSHPRARGGLDTRLGASLEPWKDVSCQIYREWDTAGRVPTYGFPPNRVGIQPAQRTVRWPVPPPQFSFSARGAGSPGAPTVANRRLALMSSARVTTLDRKVWSVVFPAALVQTASDDHPGPW